MEIHDMILSYTHIVLGLEKASSPGFWYTYPPEELRFPHLMGTLRYIINIYSLHPIS